MVYSPRRPMFLFGGLFYLQTREVFGDYIQLPGIASSLDI